MCGIVGAITRHNVTPVLLEGLRRLEYRGYDSAGIAVINAHNDIQRLRTLGKVSSLEQALHETPLSGNYGIAHTRWATHGAPSEQNAHPHMSGQQIAIVHNGIIENYVELKEKLQKHGYEFSSETDTEVAAHLLDFYLKQGADYLTAMRTIADEMQGAFAMAALSHNHPDAIAVVRQGSPLVIGLGQEEHFIASDHLALLPFTKDFIYLEESDVALITRYEIIIVDAKAQVVERKVQHATGSAETMSKGNYRHFMLKEIYEQPQVITETLSGRLGKDHIFVETFGQEAPSCFAKTETLQIVACGTSYHAGMVARYWCEELLNIPCHVEIASEFRYRKVVVPQNTLFVTVSQSGETADTLGALRHAKQMGYLSSLAICNVPGSSLVRESALSFLTRAGTEIGVASTKAFTTQLTSFLMLILAIAKAKQVQTPAIQDAIQLLKHLPKLCEEILTFDTQIQQIACRFVDKANVMFLGRGMEYPIALEGALKLKEISYIHAEAYPAGELKHGPLALIDNAFPVIAIAPYDELFAKIRSNLHEVQARGAELYVLTDEASDFQEEQHITVIRLPDIPRLISPIAYTIPLQLLAYHVAVLRGTDVDQPRNLAKSVTVE